jgi:Protein of unknwon function (DUF3310)
MSTQDYINQYLESIGFSSDWRSTIDNEDYYVGIIITTLSNAQLSGYYSIERKQYLLLGSQWIKQLINKIENFYFEVNKGNTDIDIPETQSIHPEYYNQGKIETIAFLGFLGLSEDFCLGNAIKYLSRYRYKGKPVEDLRKAEWYINYLIK